MNHVPRETATFSERLAYARWLKHFTSGSAPGNAEIGRAVDRTGPWVTKWADSETPPPDYRVHRPLAAFLGVEEAWLIRDEGEPPRRDLWQAWIEERRRPKTAALESPAIPAPREIAKKAIKKSRRV